MVFVKKMPGETDDSLIRKFSRKVMNEGIIQEVKNRQFHLKPSLKKKIDKEESRRTRKLWVTS